MSLGMSIRGAEHAGEQNIFELKTTRLLPIVSLTSPSLALSHPVLVDSEADANFMDYDLASKLNLPFLPLSKPVDASALDGRLLCKITQHTPSVKLTFPESHTEELCFHLYQAPLHLLILGHPWIVDHNPHIDWSTGKVKNWGTNCERCCFTVKKKDCDPPVAVQHKTISPEPPASETDFLDLSYMSSCYMDLKEVFNKSKATSLPPHHPYDCAIDLLPSSSPPKGCLYSLSGPEIQAMKDYIDSSLAAGIIRPSSSLAGAGFFFVGKKDKTLRQCINYRGLNDITIKNRYPLPLISSGFEL